MKIVRTILALFLIAIIAGCAQPTEPVESDFEAVDVNDGEAVDVAGELPKELLVYKVVQTGLTDEQGTKLAEALGIEDKILDEFGGSNYAADNFLFIPTIEVGRGEAEEDKQEILLERIDFEALAKTQVLPEEDASKVVNTTLAETGLLPENWGSISGDIVTGHSVFEGVDLSDPERFPAEGILLDTHVDYALMLDGIPLEGPGAQIKVVLNGDGQVTLLSYAMRSLEPADPVTIMSLEEAAATCDSMMQTQGKLEELSVKPELIYYAPSLQFNQAEAIYPHYKCGGTAQIGGEEVQLRNMMIPAATDAGPRVNLAAQADGSTITARASVEGGAGPYTYVWGSAVAAAELPNSPEVSYDLAKYEIPSKEGLTETVAVTVFDVNGLQTFASQTFELRGVVRSQPPTGSGQLAMTYIGGVIDVGTDWTGICQGLFGSAFNAGGFANTFQGAGRTVRFNWGDANAWERDFIDRDERSNGLDHDMVDNVDFVFYTGHASGTNFTFCSQQQDGNLRYNDDPSWGDTDLEWLTIAACGPLQSQANGESWSERWGPAFDGLHLMMAYRNVSNDNTIEGAKLAQYALDGERLLNAWVRTAVDVQPNTVTWGVMGVFRTDGVSNTNDHFWGEGSVGPDIRGSDIQGFWLISGPS